MQFESKEPISEIEKSSLVNYEDLNKSLLDIENIPNAQAKGYAFEKYLKHEW